MTAPQLVLLSGSLSQDSRTNRIARWCAGQCAARGATTSVFCGADLDFPFYRPDGAERTERETAFLDALADSDGVILVSPAYHGTVSGLLKNALDYVNELARDTRPYLDGRVIGCVSVALSEQGAGSTLTTLRTIGHALRGWPTPLGVALAGARASLDSEGGPADPVVHAQMATMLGQVLGMAKVSARRRERSARPVGATA
ncbi:NADPH-dependent oxidoreductase [Actinomadura craniellae]|uniref:NADPH-dependent oxidoreductase n=1 Tax=Actinomadura craniellae TaxID=2231787 RepID=A0A365HAV8_9ACTN|nr:NAD(P)H-dependent oxidoreductase [Actinomadura craniellae]RAY16152.1 NADPH-dependent oxidoreductase [Actinomadura craniellae]